jgi:hypothetical protein
VRLLSALFLLSRRGRARVRAVQSIAVSPSPDSLRERGSSELMPVEERVSRVHYTDDVHSIAIKDNYS